MKKRLIHLIAAARPNFMKVGPLYFALEKEAWCKPVIIHTGQHYDYAMSEAFLKDLKLPKPEVHLGIGSGSHAEQTGKVMIEYEKTCFKERPSLVIVVGDVNSTLACAITSKKMCLPLAHVEAGLRSFDRTMPEEVNRIVTDALSDLLFTPSPDADINLMKEGIPEHRIFRVGNIMIDSYLMLKGKIAESKVLDRLKLEKNKYLVATFHRPVNVDKPDQLVLIVKSLVEISKNTNVVLPVHPRTKEMLIKFRLMNKLITDNVIIMEPLGYLDFMRLVENSSLVITDSGGIQEETTYLGIPCLTIRDNTERPITITQGTNRLARVEEIIVQVDSIIGTPRLKKKSIDLWDGKTAERIVNVLKDYVEIL